MKVKSESEVAQLCPTLSDPLDCSPPGSSIHGIFQARVLEWGAIAFSVYRYTESQIGIHIESIGGTTLCSAKKPESYLFLLLPCRYQHTKVWSKENRKRNAIWDVIILELLIFLNK